MSATTTPGKTMKKIYFVCLLAALAFSATASDTPAARPQGPYKIDKSVTVYDIHPDATFTETSEIVMTVLTEPGINQVNQADISYSSSLESITVLYAYTQKKDGTRIDVPAGNIQDRDVVDGGGPMYSDFKGKVIIFLNLEVGDKAAYGIKTEQKIPMFPGQFSHLESFYRNVVIDDAEISMSTPLNGLALKTFSRGIDGGRLPDSKDRANWHWQWRNPSLADDDDYVPADEAPTLMVSSFKDFAELANAYEARARAKAAVTPKIQSFASELTQKAESPAEQARILYTWVARNIRYAGNCIGVGSVVPHDAEMILENRLGDCKDHTALLQALLAAKGIDSIPVLVNSGGRYKLPELPIPEYFNHVINYIPSMDIYADSTADFIPFGSLPFGEAGKMVLPTRNFTSPVQTPLVTWEDYQSHSAGHLKINADGSAEGDIKNSDSPLAATRARSYFANLGPKDAKDYVRKWFASSGLTGSGDVKFDDPRAGITPYTYGLHFHAEKLFDIPGGAGAFYVSSGYNSGMPISSWVHAAAGKPAKHNFHCSGSKSVEDYRYDLPDGLKILWLPKDIHIAAATASYEASYRQEGKTITVHRQLEYRIAPHMCTPAEYEAVRPVATAIAKDLRAQILYQMD
jgi:transglutaminase-like putative cysteine protease